MDHFYSLALQYINHQCDGYIGSSVASMAQAIAPAAYTLLGVYVLLWGFAHLRGIIQEPIMDAVSRIIKIGLILSVAINLASYNTYVTDICMNGPDQLATALTHSVSESSIQNDLDKILKAGDTLFDQYWAAANTWEAHGWGLLGVALLVLVATILVTLYSFCLIMLAKIALSVIISLGPLFILSLLFQATGNFFSSWVQQLANYCLIRVLVSATNFFFMGLCIRFANRAINFGDLQIGDVIPFILACGGSILVLAQIPTIAASLAGGVSISSYGMGRMGLAVLGRSFGRVGGETRTKASRATKKYAQRKWNSYRGSRNRVTRD